MQNVHLYEVFNHYNKISCFITKTGLKRDQIQFFAYLNWKVNAHIIFVFHPIFICLYILIVLSEFSSLPTEFHLSLMVSEINLTKRDQKLPIFKIWTFFIVHPIFNVVFCKIFNLISFFLIQWKQLPISFWKRD